MYAVGYYLTAASLLSLVAFLLIREDLNVPVKNGVITSDARLRAALPTIKAALEKGAAVMVFS
ncbi:phosphoglycerate kinase, partial [Acinetobacter nosocomialis]|uniref:phosphoglycerate kinase n=1 Tax=Acinetobacter nosocomialis TaxID=106654 RepID=UPI001D182EF4